MKNLILFLIVFLLSIVASAQFTDAQKQYLDAENLLKNPGFEQGLSNYTKTGSSVLTQVTSGVNLIKGKASASWDAANNTETLSTKQYTVPERLKGQNCQAGFWYKGGDANLIFEVLDGSSNVLYSQTMSAATVAIPLTVNMPCPASSTIGMRLRATADAAVIYLDTLWLGEPTNLYQLSQSSKYGSITFPAATNCYYQNSSTSYITYSADSDCVTPTVTGSVVAPATKVPTFIVSKPGYYLFMARGNFQKTSNAGAGIASRFYDGTNASGEGSHYAEVGSVGARIDVGEISGSLDLSAMTSPRTIQLQLRIQGGADNANIDITSMALKIDVYFFPSETQQALKPDVANWFVDATIASANPSLGTGAVGSWTPIEDGSLALTNTSLATLSAMITCSSTNPATGTTCSAGNEQLGIAVNIPRAGKIEVCFTGSWEGSVTSTSGYVAPQFTIARTAYDSQSIIEYNDGASLWHQTSATSDSPGNQVNFCSVFNVPNVGLHAFRLQYQQSVSGTVGQSLFYQNFPGRPLRFRVRPVDQNVPTPLLVNSVVNSYEGVTKINSVRLNGSSSCAVSGETGDWINGTPTHTGTGICTATFNSGIFSALAVCYCSVQSGTLGGACIIDSDSVGFVVKTFSTTTANPLDSYVHVLCIGPR